MTGHDPEIDELRDKVHCAVALERTPPPALEARPEGEHKAQPEVPARQRRNPDRQSRRARLVGSGERRQRRRLWRGTERVSSARH